MKDVESTSSQIGFLLLIAELLDEGIHNFHQIFASSFHVNFPPPRFGREQKKYRKTRSNGQKVTPPGGGDS